MFEFLAQDHTDSTEVLTNLYNSQKNQFNNLYDSKVLSSCQNLFPTVFGRSSSDGLDTSRTLPGLTSADKWDNNGVTGLRFQLARELINLDTQLNSAISVAFRDLPDAAALAKELLYRSKKFVTDLSNFISQDFNFWRAKGYDKKSSWELTCCSVRRLYEDIHQVRIIARDVRDLDDMGATTSLILWATLRSHKVMEDYTRRNFYEHPSISAVIARHLAANHTKPDDALELRVRKLEDRLQDYSRRFDQLESRLVRLEQKKRHSPSSRREGQWQERSSWTCSTRPLTAQPSPPPSSLSPRADALEIRGGFLREFAPSELLDVAILAQSWPTWAQVLSPATGFHCTTVQCVDQAFSSFWASLCPVLEPLPPTTGFPLLDPGSRPKILFLSGPLDFVLEYWVKYYQCLPIMASLDLNQSPSSDLISQGLWFQLQHSDYGGVTTGIWWFGTTFNDLTLPDITPSYRRLKHALSDTKRGRRISPPECPEGPFEGPRRIPSSSLLHPGGFLPIMDLNTSVVCPSVFSPTDGSDAISQCKS